jgi:hypothetical protein
MPKSVFEKLRTKYENEKDSIQSALVKAYNSIPEQTNYKDVVLSLHEAIDTFKDDCSNAEEKNKVLKTIIDKIECGRPPSVRMTTEEAKEKGVVTDNGWYSPDFELAIFLLL